MRSPQFAAFTILGLASVASVSWADPLDATPNTRIYDGTNRSIPMSTKASNIVPEDTTLATAPALPDSSAGADASPLVYLRAARRALAANRTGEAQQSLEMAETRALTRVVTPEMANMPDPNPEVTRIRNALHALGAGDRGRAIQIIDAMAD
jgi:hypothetical protein